MSAFGTKRTIRPHQPLSAMRTSRLCHDGAGELISEVGSHFRTSETPADKILAFLALAAILMRLDTAFAMPLMHGV
jgi:hypothetical protein